MPAIDRTGARRGGARPAGRAPQPRQQQRPRQAGRRSGVSAKARMTQIVNVFLIAVSIMIIFALVFIYRQSSTLLANENVYAGVHVNSADVSGFTYDELLSFLDEEFGGDLNEKEITIKINDVTKTFSFSDLGVSYDIESAAQEAFSVGRDGNPVKRLQDISSASRNSVGVDMVFTYNHDKADEIANAIAEEAGVLSEDAEVRYTPASVIIKPGRTGVSIDKDDLADQLKSALENFESATIEVKLKMSEPDSLNADRIFNTIYKEPVDAAYRVVDHKTVEIVPEVVGQTVDKILLGNAIASLNSNSEDEVTVPLTKVEPAIKRADLDGAFFQDKLGSASTNFSVNSTNNKNRKTNMSLASEKIAGFVMAPGDEFAFNEVVGQRTAAAGYQMAGAFMNGQLLDDIGGGICQVSSTLYNAVLYADLEVSARQNHSYIVTYVEQGFDATVSYPQPDFKFKNSTGHPIRIEGGVDGTTISFSISGTQVGPKKKIEFSHKLISTTPFEEEITEDPTLPEGTRVVRQAGKTGYTIESYKTEQIGSEPAKTTKLATNKYKSMKQLVTVGTMPAPEGEATPEPTVLLPAEGEENFVSDPAATTGAGAGDAGASGAGNAGAGGEPSEAGGAAGETGDPGAGNAGGAGDAGSPSDPAASPERTPRPARTPRPTKAPQEPSDAAGAGGADAGAGGGSEGTGGESGAAGGENAPAATRTPRPRATAGQQESGGDASVGSGAGIIGDAA